MNEHERIRFVRDAIADRIDGAFGEYVPSAHDSFVLYLHLDGYRRSYEITLRERLT